MNIAFITTVSHNVGDDFVRDGLKFILKKFFKSKRIYFTNVHKHSPITARYGFEWVRNINLSNKLDSKIPIWLTPDRIVKADIVVQSGAPVYWCNKNIHCADNEWYIPLIKQRYLKVKNKAKLLNLAAGTCQVYHSDASEFLNCAKDISYIKEFYDLCHLTTVRDSLAKKLLEMVDRAVPVIPCSSIFAVDELCIKKEDSEYVVINYMTGGGHFSFGQNINDKKWIEEVERFYNKIKKYEKVVFSCHNKNEVILAKKIDGNANIFYSKNYIDFIRFYSKAKFGFMNRVHGAFLMASFGVPSFVIGTDTRAKMSSEIGLEHQFVNNVNYNVLLDKYESFLKFSDDYTDKIKEIKGKAYKDYIEALATI